VPTRGTSRAARHVRSHEKAYQHDPASALGHRVTPEEREQLVAEAAYFRAEKRDFAPGGDVDDWLEAELAIDRALIGSESKEA